MRSNKEHIPMVNKMVLIITFILVVMIVLGELFLESERMRISIEDVLYTGEFYRVKNGETTLVEVPSVEEVERGETLIVETKLPDVITSGQFFCYNSSHQIVSFYIKSENEFGSDNSGMLIQTYDTSGKWLFGNNSSSGYVMVPMISTYAGKILRIESISNSVYNGVVNEAFFKDENAIWQYVILERMPSFAIAVVNLLIGLVISLGCFIIQKIIYKKMISLAYLGHVSFAVGAWILCESRYRQIIFSNFSIVAWMAYLMIYMYPATTILYFNEIQERRYNWVYRISIGFLFTGQFICLVLHLTKVADLLQTMFVSYAICVITALSITITMIEDVRKKRLEDYGMAVVGFAVQIIFLVFEMYADAVFHMKNVGLLAGVGNIVFVILASINTAQVVLKEVERQRRLAAEGDAKAQFLANMSHEIRTPLNAILGMNQMILRDSSEKPVLEYAKNIGSSGDLLLSIINDILDFSRISSGKMEIVNANYELSKLIYSLETTLYPKAEQKGLKFKLNVDVNAPEYLNGDEVRIRQVAINFINNAIKYTDEGEVEISIGGYYVTDNSFELNVNVKDTGKGIKDEDKSKLFSAFDRVDLEKNRTIEGTGLGLSIANSLVNLMEGRISVESEYGVGSTFSFAVPQKIVKHERVGDYKKRIETTEIKQEKYKASIVAPNAKILIVDDTKTNLTIAKLLLRETKAKITLADSGQKALDILTDNDFDIIFLDHMMPGMDGIETLNRIKTEHPLKICPILALTANAVSGSREMYLSHGFDDYVSKPVTTEALEAALKKWLPKDLIH